MCGLLQKMLPCVAWDIDFSFGYLPSLACVYCRSLGKFLLCHSTLLWDYGTEGHEKYSILGSNKTASDQ